jgi:hypothetical protein
VGERRTDPDADRSATDDATGRRLTVAQAAAALGISDDAVRSRIRRRTLHSVRERGRVFVILNGATDEPTDEPTVDDRLYGEMRARIESLERQVDAERQAHAEARRIIAGLVERIPAIEAPSEPRESAQTDAESGESTSPRPDAGDRPWWRRIFGG